MTKRSDRNLSGSPLANLRRSVVVLLAFGCCGPAFAQGTVPILPSDPQRLCTELEVVDGVALFEGDIVLGTCQRNGRGEWEFDPRGAFAERATGLLSAKAGVTLSSGFWPDAVVPYVISDALSEANAPDTYADIRSAIRHWHGQSTVELVPRTTETHYVEFVSGSRCSSSVGRVGGRQTITLWPSGACGFGSTVHEIGHALGFFHEQSRQDRDTYVTIVSENIEEGREHNFNQYGAGTDLNAYDYGSIMHYGATAFSINDANTIDIVQENYDAWAAVYGDQGIGQRRRLSDLDRRAADDMYNVCWDTEPAGAPSWRANPWRACSASCAAPGRTREVHCHDTSGACVDDTRCTDVQPTTADDCRALLDCTFDVDNCGWDAVDTGDDFDWIPGYTTTPSSDTGPTADHTGGGLYLYTETSSPRVAGDTAFLTSVPFDSDGGTLTFWYHFYGSSLGTLDIELVPCGGTPQTLLTVDTGTTPSLDAWREASVDLPAMPDVRVRFKVTRGSSFRGDVAIDDIVFTPSPPSLLFSDGFEGGTPGAWDSTVP